MQALGRTDENPNDPLGVDLAWICLGAPSKPPLGGPTPRPSALGWMVAKVTFCFLIFISALFLYLVFADFVCYSRCLRQHNNWVGTCP